jgi:hypothetical protein
VNPEKPRHIPSYAEACLAALASQGFGAMLSLGGAFGLAYYLGDDAAPARARLGVLTHLQRIELHRPLQVIADEDERGKAERLRAWFSGEFLDGIVD